MPVILEPENYDLWLDPGFNKVEPLLDLLKPHRPDAMRAWRVSSRVNSVQNDDPACVQEYEPAPAVIQGALF
jgi:putative SOS response-associated peptidase YedK